jgi:hypothetical protein
MQCYNIPYLLLILNTDGMIAKSSDHLEKYTSEAGEGECGDGRDVSHQG